MTRLAKVSRLPLAPLAPSPDMPHCERCGVRLKRWLTPWQCGRCWLNARGPSKLFANDAVLVDRIVHLLARGEYDSVASELGVDVWTLKKFVQRNDLHARISRERATLAGVWRE